MIPLLSSKDNPLAKKIRLVAAQSRRAPAELVLVEGIRTLEEATAAEREFEVVLVSEKFGQAQREKHLLSIWHSRNIRIQRASHALLTSLSGVPTPQGALALVKLPLLTLDKVPGSARPLILGACGIQDPGNLGTLVRTALAAGVSLICTTLGTVSARNQKVIRSSAGALFHIPVVENVPPAELFTYCRNHRVKLFRANARNGVRYSDVDFQKPVAILLGNEGRGLTGKEWAQTPAIHIPMAPGVESLNVAVAGAIILFEAYRQRRGPPALPDKELSHEPNSISG